MGENAPILHMVDLPLIPRRSEFYFVFNEFVVLLRCLVLCHLVTMFCFLSFCYNILFMCELCRWTKHIRLDIDNKSNYGREYVAELEFMYSSQ